MNKLLKKNIVIFGTGQTAELAWYYFKNDSSFEIVGFAIDSAFIKDTHFFNLPIIPFEEVQGIFPPTENNLFVALSYGEVNKMRKNKFFEAKAKGYYLPSYISSKATVLIDKATIGENCFILENNTIQPFVKIGQNTVIWSGNHIGHHSEIRNHCFISSHVVVSGNVILEDECFIGVNSTLRNGITIGRSSIIGAGSWINATVSPDSVYTAPPAELRKQKSYQLRKI